MLRTLLALIAAVSQLPSPVPRDARTTADAAASAAISGRVTDQASGRPIQRAIVFIHGQVKESDGRPRDAVTDADGRYEFVGLEPGEYAVIAGPPELRATFLRQAFGEAGPMDVNDRPVPNLVLKGGEVRNDVHMSLARALAIEGRVTDENEEPMAEVNVQLFRSDGTEYPARPMSTDDRGEFRFFGLPPGRYHVCARPRSGFARPAADDLRYVRTCHLASTQKSAAADVVLTSGDASGIDIRLQRSKTYSLSGSIVDASGTPADQAFVGAIGDEESTSANAVSKQGRFVLSGLAPGRYVLTASIGGPRDPGDLRPPTRERETAWATIDMANGDFSDVVLTLSKPQTVAGRVVFESSKTRVPKGAGLVIQTNVLPNQWRFYPSRPPFSPVNDALSFQLTGIYHFPLIVGIGGFPDGWVLQSVRYGGADITDRPTDLAAEPRSRRIEIVLTDRVARPNVRVTNPDGTPARRVRVVLFPADSARWKVLRFAPLRDIDRDGRLKLAAVAPGEYLLVALDDADASVLYREPERIESVAPLARRVTIAENDERVFELQPVRLPARQ
jgi:protocatechuate 3,4-dioxygenase beta subunit